MRFRILVSLVLTFAVLSFAVVTSADGITKRVKFAKGRSSATLAGNVVRGDQDTYILGARGGQRMTVSITSTENNAVFQIENPDGEYMENAGEGDDAMTWRGSLAEGGDYKIIVGGTRGNARYRLTVSIR